LSFAEFYCILTFFVLGPCRAATVGPKSEVPTLVFKSASSTGESRRQTCRFE